MGTDLIGNDWVMDRLDAALERFATTSAYHYLEMANAAVVSSLENAVNNLSTIPQTANNMLAAISGVSSYAEAFPQETRIISQWIKNPQAMLSTGVHSITAQDVANSLAMSLAAAGTFGFGSASTMAATNISTRSGMQVFTQASTGLGMTTSEFAAATGAGSLLAATAVGGYTTGCNNGGGISYPQTGICDSIPTESVIANILSIADFEEYDYPPNQTVYLERGLGKEVADFINQQTLACGNLVLNSIGGRPPPLTKNITTFVFKGENELYDEVKEVTGEDPTAFVQAGVQVYRSDQMSVFESVGVVEGKTIFQVPDDGACINQVILHEMTHYMGATRPTISEKIYLRHPILEEGLATFMMAKAAPGQMQLFGSFYIESNTDTLMCFYNGDARCNEGDADCCWNENTPAAVIELGDGIGEMMIRIKHTSNPEGKSFYDIYLSGPNEPSNESQAGMSIDMMESACFNPFDLWPGRLGELNLCFARNEINVGSYYQLGTLLFANIPDVSYNFICDNDNRRSAITFSRSFQDYPQLDENGRSFVEFPYDEHNSIFSAYFSGACLWTYLDTIYNNGVMRVNSTLLSLGEKPPGTYTLDIAKVLMDSLGISSGQAHSVLRLFEISTDDNENWQYYPVCNEQRILEKL